MKKATLLNGGRMLGKSRARAYMNRKEQMRLDMFCVDEAPSPTILNYRAMIKALNHQMNEAFNCNHLMGVEGVLPQYPRAPKTTVRVTIDRASPSGDKSVEVTFKDGVIVKTRELKG